VSIADGGVDTTKIADGAMTTDKIADSSITQEKIAAFPDVVSRDVIGGDITTSGKTITVTPTGCWDSTGTVWLETTTNGTVELPNSNNLEAYIFIVRNKSNGVVRFQDYTTYAGAAADTTVNAYRFVSWAKNNGSGVLMPYRQAGPNIQWTTSNKPTIIASTTASFVEYTISSVLPIAQLISYVPTNSFSSNSQSFSYDGTTVDCMLHQTGVLPTLLATSTIYAKHDPSTTVIYARSITLRR
jgi:hypothetical protein